MRKSSQTFARTRSSANRLPLRRPTFVTSQVLRELVRDGAGRKAESAPAVIGSQSVRAADTVPRASRGWDNAKKVNGRKRHIAVDTMGLVLAVVIAAASVQDRGGAWPLLWNLHRASAKVLLVWADAGYTAIRLAAWAASGSGLR